ncbi:K+-transporting ATPase ATPase A chain [Thermoanaerobacter uzonensis DSM 18761]|uniref:Potassium-transporting ATPase potassium-binding subunit n=1 Tax=Thermoanaerobacter uzonensis DSM 18761 TaxID=1123369 RepID=A0A1M4VZE2_9THEO|nr:potassium-transporting ATPase subunit KdpA [Thermoanaerobacter uzonensis]SHE74082.1 K+-transporting ATPase ATPase A chain [Thermoanaerobacter uzonensis DSM 18761]
MYSNIELFVMILVIALLTKPFGTYMYKIFEYKPMKLDKVFLPVENFIYKLSGINAEEEMSWKKYALSFLLVNTVMMIIGYIILRIQGFLPLNPTGVKNMESSLAFNTTISFMTNTNLQHYAGENGITFLSQMIVIIFLMFTSAASGLVTAAAIMRGLSKKTKLLGNFYADFVRVTVRLLLPISMVVTLILVWQGVPQTFAGKIVVDTLEGSRQTIITGPVAVLESIKHLGTNGGGFFGANSSHPFENPTWLTNMIEMLLMMLLPASLIYTYGLMINNKKHALVLYISLFVIFILLAVGAVYAESHPGVAYSKLHIDGTPYGNYEGKEVRFGVSQSPLFATVTTAFTTGSVDSMHDSYTPLGGAVPLILMMLNTIFGGDGAGLQNIIMYAILTVFLTGLMVGRTPEYLGRKIETKEIKLIAIAILVHPFLILFSSALTVMLKVGASSVTNPLYHGLTQVLYEFSSAAANNGSEFAGFIGNTVFMNIMTGLVMFFGRYITIILMLAVAGSMAEKIPAPPSPGTFRTDNALFGAIFIAIVVIVGALTFFPAIILGPISEFLSMT